MITRTSQPRRQGRSPSSHCLSEKPKEQVPGRQYRRKELAPSTPAFFPFFLPLLYLCKSYRSSGLLSIQPRVMRLLIQPNLIFEINKKIKTKTRFSKTYVCMRRKPLKVCIPRLLSNKKLLRRMRKALYSDRHDEKDPSDA